MSDPIFSTTGTPQDKVIEESGELLQAIGKANRFGYFGSHPDRPKSTNIQEVIEEIDDLNNALSVYLEELIYLQRSHDNMLLQPEHDCLGR